MKSDRLAVGVDLGGTKIAAGVFDDRGALQGTLVHLPTLADGPAAKTLEHLYSTVEQALASAAVPATVLAGIGVGTTGPLDPREGKLLEAVSLPQLYFFPLRAALEERFGASTVMTNDGNCFALSEALYGPGRGEDIVLGVTLGTGCGCGVVIRGRILEGASANTGELYRAFVGDRTFDEALSGPGLERLYAERTGKSLPGQEVHDLAVAGDPQALEVFRTFGVWVGKGLGILAAAFDPGVIVLGGSVMSAHTFFEETVRSEIRQYLAPSAADRLRVVRSVDGFHAVARGAAALVFSGGPLA